MGFFSFLNFLRCFEIINWKQSKVQRYFLYLLMYNWHIVNDTYLRCTIWSVLTWYTYVWKPSPKHVHYPWKFLSFFLPSQGMRDLISLTRNWTCALQWKCWVLTTREVPRKFLKVPESPLQLSLFLSSHPSSSFTHYRLVWLKNLKK